MTQYFIVREDTAVILPIGPFLHLTAGTAVTTATIDSTEVMLSKNGGAFAAKQEATAAAHLANSGGMYSVKLNTDDTDTPGFIVGNIVDAAAAAQPIGFNCTVLEVEPFDALYKASSTAFNSSGQISLKTATQASIDAIELDTGTTLSGQLTTIDGIVDAILVDTSTTLNDKIDTIDDFLDTELAAITAAVVTASGEPAQGTPPASAAMQTKINYLYKFLINKSLQTKTQLSVYNSAGAVIDHKSASSDDLTTFTRGAIVTGP